MRRSLRIVAESTKFFMKSVSGPDGAFSSVQGGISPVSDPTAPWTQSRLPSWSPGALYCGDDLPGVPLDCFTASMIDDGSDPSWVPYEHRGCDPTAYEQASESCSGSEEEQEPMEVDQD